VVVTAKDAAKPEPRVAWVAGASGVTGSALVRLLLQDTLFRRVLALSRRPLPLEHAGQRCTDAFCALGAAGGPRAAENALREVDLTLVEAFARAARNAGASRLVVISAAGADPKAGTAFKLIKGEMEQALQPLGFDGLHLLRPGVVAGLRAAESLGAALRQGVFAAASPLLRRSKALTTVTGSELAAAMLGAAKSQRRGVTAYAGEALAALCVAGRRTTTVW
jgi:uncharacterized protein YbjT (DUF2867 family)